MSTLKQKNYTIVISIDAINSKDIDLLRKQPVFQEFIKDGVLIKEMNSIYPTLTYPCHTSIVTGELPYKHGIYNNEQLQPTRGTTPDWYWHAKHIKCDTLFTKAKKNGLSVTSILWPVTAGLRIKNNMPEIWSVTGENLTRLMLKNATLTTLLSSLKYRGNLRGFDQPFLDDFSTDLFINRIQHAPTDLFFLHLTDLDSERHYKGPFYPDLSYNLGRMNNRLQRIVQATKKAKIYDQTTFFLIGDHGTNQFKKTILLNHYFKKNDLIQVNEKGVILSYKVYAQHAGGSCHIHIPKDSPLSVYAVRQHLEDFNQRYHCIKEILTKEEALTQYGLDGPFDFVLEAEDGYTFRNDLTKNDISLSPPNKYKGDHGCQPTHPDQKTLLIAKGPTLHSGLILDSANIIDIGPTIGKLHGLDFTGTQGRIIKEIFRN